MMNTLMRLQWSSSRTRRSPASSWAHKSAGNALNDLKIGICRYCDMMATLMRLQWSSSRTMRSPASSWAHKSAGNALE